MKRNSKTIPVEMKSHVKMCLFCFVLISISMETVIVTVIVLTDFSLDFCVSIILATLTTSRIFAHDFSSLLLYQPEQLYINNLKNNDFSTLRRGQMTRH